MVKFAVEFWWKMVLTIFPSKRSSKISFQTSPEVRHQCRRKLRQLHSGDRWCLRLQHANTTKSQTLAFYKSPCFVPLSSRFKKKHIKTKKHVNKFFTWLSRDFRVDFVYMFFSPIRNDQKQKKHINKILAPTQSRDNPANLFMLCFFIPWKKTKE